MRILRGLSSQQLECGCLLGVYETYDGLVVRLIDAADPACTIPEHRQGATMDSPSDDESEGGAVREER
jgi:hypothetical protein